MSVCLSVWQPTFLFSASFLLFQFVLNGSKYLVCTLLISFVLVFRSPVSSHSLSLFIFPLYRPLSIHSSPSLPLHPLLPYVTCYLPPTPPPFSVSRLPLTPYCEYPCSSRRRSENDNWPNTLIWLFSPLYVPATASPLDSLTSIINSQTADRTVQS